MNVYSRIPALTRKQFLDTLLVLLNAELADSICGVIDGVIVGRFLGEEAIAAHGIATSIFLILSIFTYIITTGFQQPCTVAIGRGELRKANGLFNLTLVVTLAISVVLSLGGVLFPHTVARWLGATGHVSVNQQAAEYLSAVSLGTPALLFFVVLIPVLQIEGQRRLVHIGSLVMAVSDVVTDLLNVKVFHGGMWGIGMATTVSYTLGLLVLLSYFFRKTRFFHFRPRELRRAKVGHIFLMGLPAGVRVGSRTLATVFLSTMVMGSMGATTMAALSVQRNLSYLLLSVAIGLSGVVLLLSGLSYGEQDRRGLKDVVRLGAHYTIVVAGGTGLLVFLLSRPLVSLYLNPDDASFAQAVSAVRWLALSMPLMAWTRCVGCYLQGVGQSLRAVVVFVCEELVFLIACALVMRRFWGAEGVFASFTVSQLLLILVLNMAVYLRRDRRYKGLEACLCVPGTFGVPPEDRLARNLVCREEVWALAEQAQRFCKERGVTDEKAYMTSLYIEEMGNIVMIYGFSDGKPHNLEVRLSLYHGEVILRFRDDCRRFDIKEKAAHWEEDPEHPEVTLGVRMVLRACKILKYNNSLNTNNLLVVL